MRPLAITAAVVALLAVVLAACATREIPYPELAAKYGLASSRHFEPEPGLRVHYTDEGEASGRTLVLVHGFAASVHAWRPWTERLKGEYRLIALDLPGHGLTEAPASYRATLEDNADLIARLADQARIDRFVLVGNSMGGAVAIAFAMAYPERLDGLVLVDSAGWPGQDGAGPSGPPGFVAWLNNPLGRGILRWFDPRLFVRGGLKSAYLDESLVTDALVDRYAELALAPGHRDILLTQNMRPARSIRPSDFSRIETPALVMAGEQDELIPPDDARAIADALPNARLVIYPGVGHLPMEQSPEITARDLREFLTSLASGSR